MTSPGENLLHLCPCPRTRLLVQSLAQFGFAVVSASLPYFESDTYISDIAKWFFSSEVESFTEKSDICGQNSPCVGGEVGKNLTVSLLRS